MTLSQQIIQAFIAAPASLRHLRKASISWMAIYFVTGVVIFSLFTWQLMENQVTIKDSILDYFFPESWHSVSEKLADFFFEAQTKTVIGNLILSGSLVLASIFLFPIKEKFSAKFETDARYQNGASQEFPLLLQAWEETRLFLIYVTAQCIILWIGYYPYVWCKAIAITLSYLFLFFTFGLDIISPTLQRHRMEYALILKCFLKRPLLILAFGLLYSLPAVILSKWIFTIESLSLIEISGILFLVNMFLLTLAIPAGTKIASSLLPEIRMTPMPSARSIKISYSLMSILLVGGLFLHGQLIASMHHKSQLLKAEYSVDWDSFDYDVPSFSQLLNGKAFSNLSFDVEIKNPTQYDILIENSRIFVEHHKKIVSTIDLDGFDIPAGMTRKVRIKLDSTSEINKISDINTILESWRVDLHLQVWPGIPFVMNIVDS